MKQKLIHFITILKITPLFITKQNLIHFLKIMIPKITQTKIILKKLNMKTKIKKIFVIYKTKNLKIKSKNPTGLAQIHQILTKNKIH